MALDKTKKNCVLGRLSLFVTTLIWGTSFVILKDTLNDIPTFYVLALRFTGAAVLLLIIGFKHIKKLDAGYLKSGALMGLFLFLAYALQTYGLFYSTPAKNAFLTTTYCIIAPFLYWITAKRRPGAHSIIAAIVCIAGVGFVSLEGDISINIGDMLTIFCGLFFAAHILATDSAVQGKRSVIMLTMTQFAVAGILSWVSAFATEPYPREFSTGNILSIAYLCVMCTAACFVLQTFGQKYTPPSAAALIMTLESVFGALISVILGYESLNAAIIIGFALIFSAVLISETKPRLRFPLKNN